MICSTTNSDSLKAVQTQIEYINKQKNEHFTLKPHSSGLISVINSSTSDRWAMQAFMQSKDIKVKKTRVDGNLLLRVNANGITIQKNTPIQTLQRLTSLSESLFTTEFLKSFENERSRAMSTVLDFQVEEIKNLQDFSAPEGFEISIKNFIKSLVHQDVIIKALDDEATPLEADKIYLVRSAKNGQLILIVKSFKKRSEAFLAELRGLNCVESQKFKYSSPVLSIAIGKASLEGEELFLLAETVASGKELTSFISTIKTSSGSDRKVALKNAERALYRTGQALGELHSIASTPHKALDYTGN